MAVSIGHGVYDLIMLPKLAAKDATAQAAAAMAPVRQISGAIPRFTTFTFASQNGEGLYNAQFYFGERLTGLPVVLELGDFALLPEGWVVLFCSPAEWTALAESSRWDTQRILQTNVKTPDGREVAVVAGMVRRL